MSLRQRRLLFKVAVNSAGLNSRCDLGNPQRALAKLNAQTFAAFGEARSKYATTAHRLHAGAESVCTLAFKHAWLICTFHRFNSCVGDIE